MASDNTELTERLRKMLAAKNHDDYEDCMTLADIFDSVDKTSTTVKSTNQPGVQHSHPSILEPLNTGNCMLSMPVASQLIYDESKLRIRLEDDSVVTLRQYIAQVLVDSMGE